MGSVSGQGISTQRPGTHVLCGKKCTAGLPAADRSKPLIQVPGHGPFGRHARKICHGKKGEPYHCYERGLENQLGVVGLVVNCVVL